MLSSVRNLLAVAADDVEDAFATPRREAFSQAIPPALGRPRPSPASFGPRLGRHVVELGHRLEDGLLSLDADKGHVVDELRQARDDRGQGFGDRGETDIREQVEQGGLRQPEGVVTLNRRTGVHRLLGEPLAVVGRAASSEFLSGVEADLSFDHGQPVTHRGHRSHERHEIVRRQVVEQTQAEHHVEGPQCGAAQIAGVVVDNFEIREAEHILGEPHLRDMRFARLDRHDLGAVQGKLDREAAFEAAQVQDPKLVQRLERVIADDLESSPDSTLDEIKRSRGHRVDVVVESVVVGTPRPVLRGELLLRCSEFRCIHGTTLLTLSEYPRDRNRRSVTVSSGLVILSDRSIREELASGRIVIDPLDDSCIQPSSVDLHIDRYFRVFRNHTMGFIDVKQDQEELTELVEIKDDDLFILHPGEFVLGSTSERVALPDDLVARLEGKSSLGRLGLLIHSTAGFVDAGWNGHLTLELSNVANLPITLYPGMKIGQISFVRMTTAADLPHGSKGVGSKYQGQRGPTPSRYFENFREQ